LADALRIGDPAIEVRLQRNARARRMVLRVSRNGKAPTLTLPPGVPLARARDFLGEQEGWLRRQIAAGPARLPVRDGSVLPFGDGTLTVRAHAGPRFGRDGAVLLVPGREGQLAPRVAGFLRETARAACVAATARHAAALGRRACRVTLRDPRGRWGSCTATGDLMYSWRLILAPAAVLDYVVAHEVAHLAEMNHSERFWAVVRGLCPDYHEPRAWLRRHGAELHAWDFSAASA
jgi:predicted metal-dependent hydrolase